MSKKGMELSKSFWITIIAICSVLLVVILIGFISFSNREPDIVEKTEDGGHVTLNYTSELNALTLLKAVPQSDAAGRKNKIDGQYFDFSVDVKVLEASSVEYEVSIIKDKKLSTINDEDIRVYLEKEEDGTYTKVFGPCEYVPSKNFSTVGSEIGSMVLIHDKTSEDISGNYRLRLWLSNKATIQEGDYSVEVDIHALAK